MALIEIKRDPSRRDIRQFSLIWLPLFCLLLAGWAAYRYEAWPAAAILIACGVASVVLGLFKPRWMRFVFLAWMGAAFPIGWLVSHTMIAAIYYLLMTPMALVMRAVGRDPLGLKFDRQADTYWVARETRTDPSRYFRQF